MGCGSGFSKAPTTSSFYFLYTQWGEQGRRPRAGSRRARPSVSRCWGAEARRGGQGPLSVSVETPGARQGGERGGENWGSALISLLSGPIPLKMDFLMRLLAALKTQIEFWRAGDGRLKTIWQERPGPPHHHHPRDSGTPPPTQHGDPLHPLPSQSQPC